MKAILYVHGKGGNVLEAEQYKENCKGFDIIGVDYKDDVPWVAQNQIKDAYDRLIEHYTEVSLIANSIGAFFSMLALQDCPIKKALFISPILDMEQLILDMLSWANHSEAELCEKGEIETAFNETLSWDILNFIRTNPIDWKIPTEILYAENDHLTSYTTLENFIATHHANLRIMKGGEHFFHTKEQLDFLNAWMIQVIC